MSILDLLHGLGTGALGQQDGPGPMPGMQAPISTTPPMAPVPQAPPSSQIPSPQQPPRLSLLDRVGHALSAAEGHVSDAIRPNAPIGYDNLLQAIGDSPEQAQSEIAASRPSLLHSIFHAADVSPTQQYENNLNGILARKQATLGIAQQMRTMAGRLAFAQANPAPDPNDEKAYGAYLNKAMADAYARRDDEGVKLLQPIAEQFAKNLHNRPYEPQLFKGPTGDMKYFDPSATTTIPDGYTPVYKPGSQGLGTPQLFRGPKGDYVGVAPGDNDTLAKLSAQGYKPEVTARTEFVQNATQGRFDQTQMRGGVADFMKNVAPLRTKAQALNEAEMVLTNAQQSGNPTYFGPAVSRFVQAVEQSNNLRFQLLQYYKNNLDPSFKGQFEQLKDRLTNGVITPRIMAGMIAQVRDMRGLTQHEIESQRQQMVKRNSALDDVLPTSDSFFQYDTPSTPGAAPAAGAANVNDVEGYLKALRAQKGR